MKNFLACLVALFVSITAFAQTNDTTQFTAVDPVPLVTTGTDNANASVNKEWKKISKKDLMAAKHIEDILTDVPKEKYEIRSFKVTFEEPFFEYNIKGNELPEAVIGTIQKSEPGTQITIDNLRAALSNGEVRMLKAATFEITQ